MNLGTKDKITIGMLLFFSIAVSGTVGYFAAKIVIESIL